MKYLFWLCACFACLISPRSLAAVPAPRYQIVDLGSLGNYTHARGINQKGDIVGDSAGGAFLWRHGVMRRITPDVDGNSTAYALNDKDEVVGTAQFPNAHSKGDFRDFHAFLYSNNKVRNLGSLSGCTESAALGINSQGAVVGVSSKSGHDQYGQAYDYATLWSKSRKHPVNFLGLHTVAYAINQYGLIAGKSEGVSGLWRVWPSSYSWTWDSPFSVALAINAQGQIAGNSSSLGSSENVELPRHAFLVSWTYDIVDKRYRSTMRLKDLGTLPGDKASGALALNNFGDVVGFSSPNQNAMNMASYDISQSESTNACLWQNNQVFDLNACITPDSGWHLVQATGINDKGLIIGNGIYNGKERAFLLTSIK